MHRKLDLENLRAKIEARSSEWFLGIAGAYEDELLANFNMTASQTITWGTVIGGVAGFAVGGPAGAVAGAAIGTYYMAEEGTIDHAAHNTAAHSFDAPIVTQHLQVELTVATRQEAAMALLDKGADELDLADLDSTQREIERIKSSLGLSGPDAALQALSVIRGEPIDPNHGPWMNVRPPMRPGYSIQPGKDGRFRYKITATPRVRPSRRRKRSRKRGHACRKRE